MKAVSLQLLQDLRAGVGLIDLIEFYFDPLGVLPGLRMALFDEPVFYQLPGDSSAQPYAAFGPTETKFRDAINEASGELNLVLPDVDRSLRTVVQQADLGGSIMLVRRIARLQDAAHRGSLVVFQGRVAAATVELSAISIHAKRNTADANEMIRVPRARYSNHCNNRYGDDACTADLTLTQYVGAVGEGSNQLIIYDPDFGEDGFAAQEEWLPSEVQMTSGANEGQARPCAVVEECRIELAKPFIVAPAVGDTFILQRLCKKTPEACIAFDNYDHWRGYEHQPKEPLNLRRVLL